VGDGVRTSVRVVAWNLDGSTALDRKLRLLDGLAWDVLLLQEVTRGAWPRLRELGKGVWSGDHLPDLRRPPGHHSAIVARTGCLLIDLGPVPAVPSPERTATGRLRVGGIELAVASLALPPGASWGEAGKGRQADRLAGWLGARAVPMIAGIDADSPVCDAPRPEDGLWWHGREPLLFGAERAHDLRDAFRDVLVRGGDGTAGSGAADVAGTLAVPHLWGRDGGAGPCRYDHVLVSPEIAVRDVRYLGDAAREAGSEHAVVVADLTVGTG
jgi:endonuclease/exonuclease/phosphatase family metal-dependent hydrolase